MTALVVVGSMVGAAAFIAAVRQKLRSRRNVGPIQLGVGTRIRP